MNENLKGVLAFILVGAIPVGIYTLKNQSDSSFIDDTPISEIGDNIDDFERMRSEMDRDKPLGNDLLADLAKKAGKGLETEDSEKRPMPSEANSKEKTPERSVNEDEPEKTKPCTDVDVILGKNGCTKQNTSTIKEATTDNNAKKSVPRTDSAPKDKEHSLLTWKKLNKPAPDRLRGRASNYPGPVIRAGCWVIAQLENDIVAVPGREHRLTLNVRGPLQGCKLPESSGIRLVGKARMTKDGRYVEAWIETCADRSINRKSINCKGSAQVTSITGSELLEGWLYDESGWGLFWESVTAIGMTPAIAKLAETAATAKTIFTAESAGQISASLTSALDRISQKISAIYDGKEIRIEPKPNKPIMLKVLFEKDVVL